MSKSILQDYHDALEGAGPKVKERILQQADADPNITAIDLKKLTFDLGILMQKSPKASECLQFLVAQRLKIFHESRVILHLFHRGHPA